jgi:hypothetical protein
VVLLCPTLTWIYLYWTDWGNGLIFYSGNWLFIPVGVLVVPAATFFYDLLRNKMPTIKRHAIRSAIEMLVVTPVWCCIWVWIALILGLAWI